MKISIGAVIGIILAFVVAIALEGVVWWCIVNGICVVFGINFHLPYFPNSIILGMIGALTLTPIIRSIKQ